MKVFLVGLTIIAATIGGGLGYATMQTGSSPIGLPSGLASSQPETLVKDDSVDHDAEVVESVSSIEQPEQPESITRAASDVVITEDELNTMVTEAIAAQPYTAPILDIAKTVNTSIEDDRIKSGMVMNLTDIPLEGLPAEGRQAIEQMRQTFPFLADRDVYLGVEGSPTIKEGAFSLDDSHIQFGPLKLPVANVASQLGVSQTDIEQQISALLEQQGLTPADIQVIDGELVISGLAESYGGAAGAALGYRTVSIGAVQLIVVLCKIGRAHV